MFEPVGFLYPNGRLAIDAVHRKSVHGSRQPDKDSNLIHRRAAKYVAMTTMTQFALSRQTSDQSNYIPITWFASLFGLISYVAVSMRAVLSPYEVNHFIDAKRAFSVVVGAFILWLAIRAVDKLSGHGPIVQIVAVLRISIPGLLCLFLAREFYDFVASGEFAQRMPQNLRWMLAWIGYFGAAVATFLALGYHRQLHSVKPREDNLKVLLSALRDQAGYEVADTEFDPEARRRNEQISQIEQLLDGARDKAAR